MKTFRSKRYGFEMDIPDGWSLPPTGSLSRLFGLDKKLEFKKGKEGLEELITIGIGPPEFAEPDLEEIAKDIEKFARSTGDIIEEISNIQVGRKEHLTVRLQVSIAHGVTSLRKQYFLSFSGVGKYLITCSLGFVPKAPIPTGPAIIRTKDWMKELEEWNELRRKDNKRLRSKEVMYDRIVSTFKLIQ